MSGSNSRQNGDVAYSRESEIIQHFRLLAGRNKELSPEAMSEALNDMCQHYERLLDDSKLLTSVGDRLQRKLKGANLMLREQADEIRRINGSLQSKNVELQQTIDELTKARASRKAATILFVLAIALFIISELLEQYVESRTTSFEHGWILSWGFKLLLVVILKPLENLLERYYIRVAQKTIQEEKQREQEQNAAASAVTPPQPPEPVAAIATDGAAPSAGEAGLAAMTPAARRKAAAAARAAAQEAETASKPQTTES